jgi:hypothetical protein
LNQLPQPHTYFLVCGFLGSLLKQLQCRFAKSRQALVGRLAHLKGIVA